MSNAIEEDIAAILDEADKEGIPRTEPEARLLAEVWAEGYSGAYDGEYRENFSRLLDEARAEGLDTDAALEQAEEYAKQEAHEYAEVQAQEAYNAVLARLP